MGVDWLCECGNMNWARRQTCNRCEQPKAGPARCLAPPPGPPRRPGLSEPSDHSTRGLPISQIRPPPPGIDPGVGDWACGKCGNW